MEYFTPYFEPNNREILQQRSNGAPKCRKRNEKKESNTTEVCIQSENGKPACSPLTAAARTPDSMWI